MTGRWWETDADDLAAAYLRVCPTQQSAAFVAASTAEHATNTAFAIVIGHMRLDAA